MGAVGVGGVALSDEQAARPEISRGKLVAWIVFASALAGLAYYARYAIPEGDNRDLLYSYATAVGAVVQYGLMLGITLLIARGTDVRRTLALRRPRSLGRATWQTAAALAAIWITGVALSPFLPAGEEQGFVPDQWEPKHAGALAANVVVVVLVGPAVEELVYRGLGYSALRAHGSTTLAIVVTAIAFAGAHGLVVGLPILFVFGVSVALLRRATESIYPGIVLHGIFNGLALALGIAFGDKL
jgi:membrane protease YdiL (CAAX protease family)